MGFAVELSGITKRFGGLVALEDVDLHVEEGAIHALVGENGAGKTTLMRILYGAIQPEGGYLTVGGRPCRFRRSSDAIAAGIGMVSQHYSVIPELTCLDNLVLGAEPGWMLARRSAHARAADLATSMGFEFDWEAPASNLSPAGAQKLEILKLLWRESRIMILDEPTAMLSPADSEALFVSLKKLAASGATVILVTHRLPEVLEHCSRVSVLRGGRMVAESSVQDMNGGQLAEWIVGHPIGDRERVSSPGVGASVLDLRSVSVRGSRGEEALKEVDLTVAEGEIVGIAGVDGSGQRELFEAIAGLVPVRSGNLALGGMDLAPIRPRQRIEMGLRVIPEDRHEEGVVEDWSLVENAGLGCQRIAPFANGPWIDSPGRRTAAEAIAARFGTKHDGLDQRMASLSGGNQQRFVAARALHTAPKLILAFQPARGLDIDATQWVYDGLREACRKGAGALVVSFDLDELIEQCDRIVVLHCGRLASPPKDMAMDRGAIGRLMVGAE